ncbi:MAG: ABC transporter permease [Kineosporiaceae bacterium]|nr:ABC transporter permease [Aeromicrobium sp.]
MIRLVAEFVLAGISSILAIATAVHPQWIEALFRIEPDRGSGALELVTVTVFGLLALVAAGLGTRTAVRYRRAQFTGVG